MQLDNIKQLIYKHSLKDTCLNKDMMETRYMSHRCMQTQLYKSSYLIQGICNSNALVVANMGS